MIRKRTGERNKGGVEGATDGAGTQEIGSRSREGRNLDRAGHGRVRKETEQGERREIGRHRQKDRGGDGDTRKYKVIASLIHPCTHSIPHGQIVAIYAATGTRTGASYLPVAAQGWDGWRVTEADRGSS